MINLDRLDFFSGTLESLNGSLKDGINPKSFHFVAVSTLVASDLDQYTLDVPDNWPDHYSCNDRKAPKDLYEVQTKAKGLLETLGLVKKVTVERRD